MNRHQLTLLLLPALFCLVAGCSGSAGSGSQGDASTKAQPSRPSAPPPTCIGVLPTQTLASPNAPSASLDTGAQVLDNLLREQLSSRPRVRFVDAEAAQGLAGTEAMMRLQAAQQVAQNVGCSALLETEISRFVEREGGALGVQQPAAVTFSYRLFDVQTGAVLCHGRFEEQQEAILDNLFSIGKAGRRGMTWITAEELAREGLQSRINDCSYLGGAAK